MKLYNQFNNILSKKEKKYVLIVIFSIFLIGLLEMVGIGIVPTVLYGLIEPEKFFDLIPTVLKEYLEPYIFQSSILFFTFFVFIIFVLKNFFLIILNYININLRGNIREGIIYRTNKFYNFLSYKEFLSSNSSNIIRNITTESQNTSSVLRDSFFLLNEILLVAFIIILNFIFNFEITLITILVLLLPLAIYFYFTKNVLKKIGSENVEIRSKLIKTINHTIGSFKENMINGKFLFLEKYFKKILSSEVTNTKKYNFLSVIPKILFEIIVILVIILSIIILNLEKENIINEIPSLSFFIVSLIKLMPCISRISINITKIVYNLKSVEIINEISFSYINKKANYKINQLKQNKNFNFLNKIVFENVDFSYSKEKKLLQNISFVIEKNSLVLIKGMSGAGKSTLIDLILGLIKPDTGKIKIDNTNIENILIPWQNKISLLPQKTFLLEDSIKNNIIFGMEELNNSEVKIKKIVKDTNLELFINNLSDGINTKISERGKNISGGEMQRICLARSLYRNGDILICDEPTTGLDEENVTIFMNILKNLSKEKTILLVSHEKKLEEISNKILEIKNSQIKIIK
ncbi:ABC transporter ATP-binding protein/permease [Candidatus Pelagibacter sp.]|nr:ABC transporter ATP-binding protein/permease [Candidatus Pelagibacter sp.]